MWHTMFTKILPFSFFLSIAIISVEKGSFLPEVITCAAPLTFFPLFTKVFLTKVLWKMQLQPHAKKVANLSKHKKKTFKNLEQPQMRH